MSKFLFSASSAIVAVRNAYLLPMRLCLFY